jgi:hypothetical protein
MKNKVKIGYAVKHESRGYLDADYLWVSLKNCLIDKKGVMESFATEKRSQCAKMHPRAIRVVPIYTSE